MHIACNGIYGHLWKHLQCIQCKHTLYKSCYFILNHICRARTGSSRRIINFCHKCDICYTEYIITKPHLCDLFAVASWVIWNTILNLLLLCDVISCQIARNKTTICVHTFSFPGQNISFSIRPIVHVVYWAPGWPIRGCLSTPQLHIANQR